MDWMFIRPLDHALRSWQQSHPRERRSLRAAIVFGGLTSLLLWVGLATLLRRLFF